MAPPPPPPRELVDDVIPEILLRLPPDEPKWLFRAALTCKPWLRTICDPAFLHRYRAFHGAPPLLGLIDRDTLIGHVPRFVATTAVPAFPIPVSDTFWAWPLDCRHGRVLMQNIKEGDGHYLVCDPISGGRHRVPHPDVGIYSVIEGLETTAVCCAVTGCQHLDCHGGPFYVSLMYSDLFSPNMRATIYSSEIGAWSALATLENVGQAYGRVALVGEGMYFPLRGNTGIVKYDWGKNCLSVLKPPPLAMHNSRGQVALTAMEDSSLGLAAIQDSSLYLWSRAVSSVENAEWVQRRVIDLEKMMPMANPSDRASVAGFEDGVGVIFISTDVGLFMIKLNTWRVKKVGMSRHHLSVLPYMSFYTPGRGRFLQLARSH